MLDQTFLQTAFGCFEVVGSESGIQSVKLTDKANCSQAEVPISLRDCIRQLKAYFRGERQSFDLKLDWGAAPEFNKSVWRELLEIPYGHTTSYSAIAERIGNPAATRAVGLASRNNPVAIIVPCHRVIAKNGDLHGYFYGLDMKRKLLELENPMSFARQGSLF
jgi:methylated-DNA-[protein]-cysteine S-methyltransferase